MIDHGTFAANFTRTITISTLRPLTVDYVPAIVPPKARNLCVSVPCLGVILDCVERAAPASSFSSVPVCEQRC